MRKNIFRNKYGHLNPTAIFIGILLCFSIFAVQEVPAQLDKLRRAVKKVENEINKDSVKAKPTETSKPKTEAENNQNQQKETLSPASKNTNQNKKLVFSNQPIDPNNPTNLKTSFQAGEHIYGLLILDTPLKEFINEEFVHDQDYGYNITRPSLKFEVLVDGNYVFDSKHDYIFSRDDRENAWNHVPTERYFFFDIAPEPSKQKTYSYKDLSFKRLSAIGKKVRKVKSGSQYNSYLLGRLQPGNHTLTFKIQGKEQVVGEFSISGSDYSFYDALADTLEVAASSGTMLPKPQWNDAESLGSIKRAYKPLSGETVMRINLMGRGWFIQKNALGQILFRGIHAAIATKASDGKCYYQSEYFKQNYAGGRYGATVQDGRSETRQLIPCENVMK